MAMDSDQALMALLTGLALEKPHKITARTFYSRSEDAKVAVKDLLDKERKETRMGRDQLAKRRQEIAIQLWDKLSKSEQKKWEELAEADNLKRLKGWEESQQSPQSRRCQVLQTCIDNLPDFFKPILNELHAMTGFQFTILAGGPEPADGGMINVLGIHQGATNSDLPLAFPQSDPDGYETVQKVYARFLAMCFDDDERAARALHHDHPLYRPHGVDQEVSLDGNLCLTRYRARGQSCASPDRESATPVTVDASARNLPPAAPRTILAELSSPMHLSKAEQPTVTSSHPAPATLASSRLAATATLAEPSSATPCSHELSAARETLRAASVDLSSANSRTDAAPSLEPSVSLAAFPPEIAIASEPSSFRTDMPGVQSTASYGVQADVPGCRAPSNASELDFPPIATLEQDSSPWPRDSFVPRLHQQASPGGAVIGVGLPNSTPPPLSESISVISLSSTGFCQLRACDGRPDPAHCAGSAAIQTNDILRTEATSSDLADVGSGQVSSSTSFRSPPFVFGRSSHAKRKPGVPDGRVCMKEKTDSTPPRLSRIGQTAKAALAPCSTSLGNTKDAAENPSSPSSLSSISSGASSFANFPAACPSWALKALEMFRGKDFGKDWTLLVDRWVAYETRHGLNPKARTKGLEKKAWPELLSIWIRRNRMASFDPGIPASDLERGFWNWWDALQPSWRLKGDEGCWTKIQGKPGQDWGGIDSWGPTGVVNIVAMLFFWAKRIRTLQELQASKRSLAFVPTHAWKVAVADVDFVLSCLP